MIINKNGLNTFWTFYEDPMRIIKRVKDKIRNKIIRNRFMNIGD